MTRSRHPARRGMPLLLLFLSVTLGLSLWLGFQAVMAAASHRRTAEGVLRDYAEIALTEYSRRLQDGLERFIDEVFRDVPWRVRRDPPPPPEVVRDRLAGVLRRMDCQCRELRSNASFFMLDMASGEISTVPDGLTMGERGRAAELVRAEWEGLPTERLGVMTAGPEQGLAVPSALFFNVSLDESGEEGRGRAIYILMASLEGVADLFEGWYNETSLLPAAVAGSQPNDSILYLSVGTADGRAILDSPVSRPEIFVAGDPTPRELGGFVAEVGVRPEAAPTLVIGGLPRTRLPLLLALMVMTVGIGIAAFIQIRRERELVRVREDFISGVSHEFRTPLTQIRMFTELLADGKLATEEERVRSTQVIDREARRLTHLVENTLHFSQLQRPQEGERALEEILIQDALDDLSQAFASMFQARGSSLEVSVEPPNLSVAAPRNDLHRMLANILDNALKYGPREQTVRIHASRQGRWVQIAVEDEGPGVPPSEWSRIWEPYHRLKREIEGQVRGSGIGLSVVADLAHSAGGEALVEEGAHGARFVLRLPMGDGLPGETRPHTTDLKRS